VSQPAGPLVLFATLTKRRLKRGVFRSVADLQAAINRFLDHHNAHSKPFEWTADPEKIIAAVRRGHQALVSIGGASMIVTPAYIVPRHDLSLIEIDHLEDRLYDHNRRSTGRDDGKALAFVAVSEHGVQMGAIAGYSWAGVAEINQLWVDGDHRGHGVGRRLLDFRGKQPVVLKIGVAGGGSLEM
jgi:ribosomal protein S18 acetylase RimI-like enzyme